MNAQTFQNFICKFKEILAEQVDITQNNTRYSFEYELKDDGIALSVYDFGRDANQFSDYPVEDVFLTWVELFDKL